jgi:hypothetical protein
VKHGQRTEVVEGTHGELVKHDRLTDALLKYLWTNNLIMEMKQGGHLYGEPFYET